MNLMMTDSRLKHTEIKTDLNKMMDKLDSLTSQVNKLASGEEKSHRNMLMQAPEMEATIIMHNVSRIIKVTLVFLLN